MTSYGICQEFVGITRAFKCPPRCPECSREYPDYKNEINYVSDYVTHRAGYHHVSNTTVYYDLQAILNCENRCCCPRNHCKCECFCPEKCCDQVKTGREVELEQKECDLNRRQAELDRKLFKLNVLKARLDSDFRDFKQEYDVQ